MLQLVNSLSVSVSVRCAHSPCFDSNFFAVGQSGFCLVLPGHTVLAVTFELVWSFCFACALQFEGLDLSNDPSEIKVFYGQVRDFFASRLVTLSLTGLVPVHVASAS